MRLELTLPSKCTRSIVIIMSRLMGIPPISRFGSWQPAHELILRCNLYGFIVRLLQQPYGIFFHRLLICSLDHMGILGLHRLFIKLHLTTASEEVSLVWTSNQDLTNLPIVTTVGHFVAPIVFSGYISHLPTQWCSLLDLNQWPIGCRPIALTCWAKRAFGAG